MDQINEGGAPYSTSSLGPPLPLPRKALLALFPALAAAALRSKVAASLVSSVVS